MRFGFVVTTFAVAASFLSTVDAAVTKQQCETSQGTAPNYTPKCFICHWDKALQKYTPDCVTRRGNDQWDVHQGHRKVAWPRNDYVYCFTGTWGILEIASGLPANMDLDTCDVPPPPVVMGDPHIKTWAGKWYDYHGECDLVLIDAPHFANGLGLTIHIRTKIRYEYSYITSAVLRIGYETLEFSSWGVYILNGVESAQMPNHLAGFPVSYDGDSKGARMVVSINDTEQIELKNFKDMVGVKLLGAQAKDFDKSLGLMGSFEEGYKLGRDGTTVFEDMDEFGQEWQVLDSDPKFFQTIQGPQYPTKCRLPAAGLDQKQNLRHRRLGETISREAAEKACAKWVDGKEQCVYDTMATGDLSYAASGAF